MRVIVKEPNEKIGHFEDIENDINEFQRLVHGYIEAVRLSDQWDWVLVNEEGLLFELEPQNCLIDGMAYVGTVVVVGDGQDFTDVRLSLEEWAEMLEDYDDETGEN